VINKASTTSRKSNSVWISPGGDGSAVIVGGKIWSRRKAEVLYFPVESPALYAATVFKETLEKTGIRVSGKVYPLGDAHVTAVPPITPPLYEHESLPLFEIIKVVNKRSQNLHAELLLKQVGRQTGKGGSFSGGAQAVYEFARMAGADPRSTTISDGSGLSDLNRASAHSIVQLLKCMNTNGWHDTFRESLAVVGIDSNLRTLAGTVPKGRILAKTGSLKDVVALSGYAIGESEDLAFSIIANDVTTDTYTVKQIRNRICRELVRY
jgi:D-alanyl-D-alanine carboxypeptidase/D-alanyl-D-alanine-endopeptidase (penicillin-binding protein 4)